MKGLRNPQPFFHQQSNYTGFKVREEENNMDNDRIEGKLDDVKGNIKRKIGEATDDKSLQGEGLLDQAKGKIQNAVGKVKDEVRAERDKVEHKDEDAA